MQGSKGNTSTSDSELKKDGTFKNENNHQLAKKVESGHDDASSTSSCSCEDHSSVEAQSDELHEDLDYDEDSITESPLETSNISRAAAEKDSSPDPSNLKEDSCCKLTSPSSQSKFSPCSDEIYDHETKTPSELEIEKNSQSKSQNTEQNRIKSVINFDHDDEQEAQAPSDKDGKIPHEKSHKSYDDLLKYFFKDACFFQIKSINHENVELSKSMGVWSTPVQNEVRLNAAFREHRNVILIFSVQQSGAFQGFARMVSESKPSSRPIPWVLGGRLSNRSFGGVFKVEWLCRKELPFHDANNLNNPFNSNKPVKVARDGQQVEPKIGKKLCRLFPEDDRKNLLDCIATLKRQTYQRKKSPQRYDNYYPFNDSRGDYPEERHRPEYIPYHGGPGSDNTEVANPMISHNHINYNLQNDFRPHLRHRLMYPPDHGLYPRQNPPLPSYPNALMRRGYMPRNFDDMLPATYADFYPSQNFTQAINPHQYPANPQERWAPNAPTNRFHPYQRSRRAKQ